MSDNLKKFVNNNRQQFDTNEPNTDLWKKIDAQMDIKDPSRISSKWLSKFKYFGFSFSVLVVAIYFIAKGSNFSSENKLASNKKDSVTISANNSKAFQNIAELTINENKTANEINDISNTENKLQDQTVVSSVNTKQNKRSTADSLLNARAFEASITNERKNNSDSSVTALTKDVDKIKTNSLEKKETTSLKKSKKNELFIPEEPKMINSYTGTLYESSSICSVVRAYKFPGKFSIDHGGDGDKGGRNDAVTIKTTSCSRLENMSNIKVVWLKGKTDKKTTISIKKKFKNIVLIKHNGKEINPEAISHYYPGRGVISDYKGKRFNMIFKDKVEFILFFKDAEEGDKIIIDGLIETVVTGQPK